MFVETKRDGEAQKPVIGREDFIAWLRTKDPAETYNFMDYHGECAVGQYMAARGREWRGLNYGATCRELGIDPCDSQVLCTGSQTFGALLQRMIALRAAA